MYGDADCRLQFSRYVWNTDGVPIILVNNSIQRRVLCPIFLISCDFIDTPNIYCVGNRNLARMTSVSFMIFLKQGWIN